MKQALAFLTVVVVVCSSSLDAFGATGDWPQWRGTNRDGRSQDTGLLKQWPEGGPKLVWKATGLGIGYTNVSVVGDRNIAMGDKEDSSCVIALNKTDGQLLWTAKVGKGGAPGWGGFAGPRCTPTVDDNRVFVVAQYGEVACLDAATGKEYWHKDYVKDFGGAMPDWGYCGMPIVDGGKVILMPGGKQGALAALDKKTGELIWQSKELTDDIHYSSPIVAEIGGVRQYIQLTVASVAGIAADDGRLLWRAARKGSTAVIPTPIYRDNYVYVTSGYGAGCNLFKISSTGGEFSAEQVYANRSMTNHHGGAVLVGNHVYGFSDGNGWVCQDFATGDIVWNEKSKLGKGSLVYADGMLYLRAEADAGTIVMIEATPDGFKEMGRFDQPDRSEKNSWPHPVVTGGRLYIRDQDLLLSYDVQGK